MGLVWGQVRLGFRVRSSRVRERVGVRGGVGVRVEVIGDVKVELEVRDRELNVWDSIRFTVGVNVRIKG